jgi:hypothetical protein
MRLAQEPYKPSFIMFLRDFSGFIAEDWKPYLKKAKTYERRTGDRRKGDGRIGKDSWGECSGEGLGGRERKGERRVDGGLKVIREVLI